MNSESITTELAESADQKRWDAYVFSATESVPYHLFAWKKAMEEAYGHECRYYIAGQANKIVGILPLVRIRLLGVKDEWIGLPFCDVGNVVADSETTQDLLVDEAIRAVQISRAGSLELRGSLVHTKLVGDHLYPTDTDKVRMFLRLPSSSDELMKGFKSKLRSQVKKAAKNGVTFRWGQVEDIDRAYAVFSKNMHELGSPVHSKSFLKAVLVHFGVRAKLGLAEFQGKTIGMGIILLGGNCVSIPWASTLREHNRLGPNMLLYWNFMKYSADSGFDYFDFGRSSEGEGTYKFKKQWGAEPRPLAWYKLGQPEETEKSSSYAQLDKRELLADMWRRLPLGVANWVGPHLRKYISL